ncbi:phage tail protein [Vibrio cholerae]|nr:phage tail protein [Vibrio cholerae]
MHYYMDGDTAIESSTPIDGVMEISSEDYKNIIAAKLDGRKTYIKEGALIVCSGVQKSIWNCTDARVIQIDTNEPVPVGWTDLEPQTKFDNWDQSTNSWVTDKQAEYEFEINRITNIRQGLYYEIVDRLNSEANMIRRIEGDEVKAAEYEAQADAAYLKIRTDNPWPTPPEV